MAGAPPPPQRQRNALAEHRLDELEQMLEDPMARREDTAREHPCCKVARRAMVDAEIRRITVDVETRGYAQRRPS